MKIIYAQSTMYRKPEYGVSTQIAEAGGERFVLKKALSQEAIPFVNGFEKNYQEMARQYGEEHVAKGELLSPGVFKMEYVDGETLAANSMRYFKAGEFDGFIRNIAYYYEHIVSVLEDNPAADSDFDPLSKERKCNIDLTFDNIIVSSKLEEFKIIDYEWLFPSLSKRYVLARIMFLLYQRYQRVFDDKNMTMDKLISGCMLEERDIRHYHNAEREFYRAVIDSSSKKNEKNTFMVNL